MSTNALSTISKPKKMMRLKDRLRAAAHQNERPLSTSKYIEKIAKENSTLKSELKSVQDILNRDDEELALYVRNLNERLTASRAEKQNLKNDFNHFKNEIVKLDAQNVELFRYLQTLAGKLEHDDMNEANSKVTEWRQKLENAVIKAVEDIKN